MPHAKSCKKRLKTNKKANISNSHNRAQMRSAMRTFRATIGEATDDQKVVALREMYSLIDTNARKGLMPRSRAARLKGRFAAFAAK
ncbi:MAG: 30S ribosomal protein S20 [bacterium]|nr:30S ribosomal protein S20 [bacterium]